MNKLLLVILVLFLVALYVDGTDARRRSSCRSCSKLAVRKCGARATVKARRCRNLAVRRCNKRKIRILLAKRRGRLVGRRIHRRRIHKRRLIKRRIHRKRILKSKIARRRTLRTYCRRVAVRRCGKGRKFRSCRRKIRISIKRREKRFRLRLRRCGGRRGCVVRACTSRARRVAKRKGKGRKFIKRLLRRFTRLNCTRRVRRIVKRKIHRRRIVKKRVVKRNIRNYCRRAAVRRCGSRNGSCARKLIKRIKKREKRFDRKLKSCGGRRGCIVRACKARAKRVAKRKGKGTNYVKRITVKYTKMHCGSPARSSGGRSSGGRRR